MNSHIRPAPKHLPRLCRAFPSAPLFQGPRTAAVRQYDQKQSPATGNRVHSSGGS